jgi:hypothetical protein
MHRLHLTNWRIKDHLLICFLTLRLFFCLCTSQRPLYTCSNMIVLFLFVSPSPVYLVSQGRDSALNLEPSTYASHGILSDHFLFSLIVLREQHSQTPHLLKSVTSMDGTRTYPLPKKAYDDFVAIKRHNILQTRDGPKESSEYIASRWTLSFFRNYCAFP